VPGRADRWKRQGISELQRFIAGLVISSLRRVVTSFDRSINDRDRLALWPDRSHLVPKRRCDSILAVHCFGPKYAVGSPKPYRPAGTGRPSYTPRAANCLATFISPSGSGRVFLHIPASKLPGLRRTQPSRYLHSVPPGLVPCQTRDSC
jgi:hypothetical protein